MTYEMLLDRVRIYNPFELDNYILEEIDIEDLLEAYLTCDYPKDKEYLENKIRQKSGEKEI